MYGTSLIKGWIKPQGLNPDMANGWVTVFLVDAQKVCRCYPVNFLDQTPIFASCVVRCASKNRDHKGTCLKEIGLCL